MLMLYLSIFLLIPLLYSFLIPIFIKPTGFISSMYYYMSYLMFLSCSSIINLISFTYSILQMDVITWGKTRSIVNTTNTIVNNEQNSKDIKDGYIELEYDYNYLDITAKYDAIRTEV